jgi:glutamine amidotransferase
MDNSNDIIVSIIDFHMGNLFSVKNACDYVRLKTIITSDKSVLMNSNAIIIPGVGAFGVAIDNLKKLDLIAPIKNFIESGKPVMGICLGMQLLMSESEEFGNHKGLDIIPGRVVKFKNNKTSKLKVPQVGWNQIFTDNMGLWENTPLKTTDNYEFMYFVHSYYTIPDNKEYVLSNTNYSDIIYCSGIQKENIFAFQFHPERSSKSGLEIYKNFKELLIEKEV